ncbi:MAG TPA: hypothetical protein VMT62_14680 [Syntrophorhabdaceae bacterium]|nr:hypothetical protein [Syntrophorhabdaceae bacterium]
MKNLFICAVVCIAFISCNKGLTTPVREKAEADVAETQYKKELEEIKKTIKGDTKIKLRKDAKGYSWEISGKDPQEILKANETLARKLDNAPPR